MQLLVVAAAADQTGRTIGLLVIGLVGIAAALAALTIWYWRATRPRPSHTEEHLSVDHGQWRSPPPVVEETSWIDQLRQPGEFPPADEDGFAPYESEIGHLVEAREHGFADVTDSLSPTRAENMVSDETWPSPLPSPPPALHVLEPPAPGDNAAAWVDPDDWVSAFSVDTEGEPSTGAGRDDRSDPLPKLGELDPEDLEPTAGIGPAALAPPRDAPPPEPVETPPGRPVETPSGPLVETRPSAPVEGGPMVDADPSLTDLEWATITRTVFTRFAETESSADVDVEDESALR